MTQVLNRPNREAAERAADSGIAASTERAIVARQQQPTRKSALALMAERLHISPENLRNTLIATVFKGANETEFAALVVVAEAYKLNPLLKEIYAFPQKGGGIVPVVSVDGWISLMNRHPQFDGIHFKDIPDDKGNLAAVETTIWRKDRTRPTCVIEYLSECRRDTDPWRKAPARMLRHKSLIQCNRIAFGFSGIYDIDEAEAIDGGQLGVAMEPMPAAPTRQHVQDAQFDAAEPAAQREPDLDAARKVAAQDESLAHLRDPADPGPGHDADGVYHDGGPVYDPQPDPEFDETALDTLQGRINRAASVGSMGRIISDIQGHPALREEWRATLLKNAEVKKAELAGGAK